MPKLNLPSVSSQYSPYCIVLYFTKRLYCWNLTISSLQHLDHEHQYNPTQAHPTENNTTKLSPPPSITSEHTLNHSLPIPKPTSPPQRRATSPHAGASPSWDDGFTHCLSGPTTADEKAQGNILVLRLSESDQVRLLVSVVSGGIGLEEVLYCTNYIMFIVLYG